MSTYEHEQALDDDFAMRSLLQLLYDIARNIERFPSTYTHLYCAYECDKYNLHSVRCSLYKRLAGERIFIKERARNEIINCVGNKRMVKFNFVRSTLCRSRSSSGEWGLGRFFYIKLSLRRRQTVVGGARVFHMPRVDRYNKHVCVSMQRETLFLSCYVAPAVLSSRFFSRFSRR